MHLRKQAVIVACPMYQRLRRFPASQEDKHKDKKKKKKLVKNARIQASSVTPQKGYLPRHTTFKKTKWQLEPELTQRKC